MSANLTALAYLAAAVLFVLALHGLSSPESARRGNVLGITGMLIAVGTTVVSPEITSYAWIVAALVIGGAVGTGIGLRIRMTAMPQLVAAFHSLVGLAAVLVAAAALIRPEAYGIADAEGVIHLASRIEMSLGAIIGAITFSGSVVAFTKLQGLVSGNPVTFAGQHLLNLALALAVVTLIVLFVREPSVDLFWAFTAASLVLGVLVIIPIGGADMPVVISMLNSYSGWAAAGIGFTLQNSALIITGALVGSSGAILSYIMVRAMNRSFVSVILGGFGGAAAATHETRSERPVKAGSADDAAFILRNATSVIIVPGYGMAVAQAQHSLAEMVAKLKAAGAHVRYGIHPVAGRMPGHMNVLLAEANVPHEDVVELESINSDFANTDVAFVIGANDVTNPAARHDPSSPIFGMPVLEVDRARTVLFVKRSLAPGYAGIDNDLFYAEDTMMLFSDAKKMVQDIAKELGP